MYIDNIYYTFDGFCMCIMIVTVGKYTLRPMDPSWKKLDMIRFSHGFSGKKIKSPTDTSETIPDHQKGSTILWCIQ